MFITDDFIIGHIPKTGGHALALMLTTAGIKPQEPFPFKIVDGKIIEGSETKHIDFSHVEHKDVQYYLVLRKLDTWIKSIYWHYSKHFVLNNKGNFEKSGIGKSYHKKFKKVKGHLPPPQILAHSIYPDKTLDKFLSSTRKSIKFLRMEFIRKDIKKELNIDLPELPINTYSYAPPQKYWNNYALKLLYENNPKWASLERALYHNPPS